MTELQKAERDAAKLKWLESLPKCVGYDGGCDGGFMEEHQDNCPMKGHPEVSLDITWEAAFEAGRSATEQELRRAASAVLDELDNGYPGYDQYSSDVQYETVEALRSALKAA